MSDNYNQLFSRVSARQLAIETQSSLPFLKNLELLGKINLHPATTETRIYYTIESIDIVKSIKAEQKNKSREAKQVRMTTRQKIDEFTANVKDRVKTTEFLIRKLMEEIAFVEDIFKHVPQFRAALIEREENREIFSSDKGINITEALKQLAAHAEPTTQPADTVQIPHAAPTQPAQPTLLDLEEAHLKLTHQLEEARKQADHEAKQQKLTETIESQAVIAKSKEDARRAETKKGQEELARQERVAKLRAERAAEEEYDRTYNYTNEDLTFLSHFIRTKIGVDDNELFVTWEGDNVTHRLGTLLRDVKERLHKFRIDTEIKPEYLHLYKTWREDNPLPNQTNTTQPASVTRAIPTGTTQTQEFPQLWYDMLAAGTLDATAINPPDVDLSYAEFFDDPVIYNAGSDKHAAALAQWAEFRKQNGLLK